MGTRSLTHVYGESGDILCTMYRQYDGYPSGHGVDLAEFCADITLVNGISPNYDSRIANGMSCFAAQMIAHFKDGPGGFYLEKPGGDDMWEEYVYRVKAEGDKLWILCRSVGSDDTHIEGTAKQFLKLAKGVE